VDTCRSGPQGTSRCGRVGCSGSPPPAESQPNCCADTARPPSPPVGTGKSQLIKENGTGPDTGSGGSCRCRQRSACSPDMNGRCHLNTDNAKSMTAPSLDRNGSADALSTDMPASACLISGSSPENLAHACHASGSSPDKLTHACFESGSSPDKLAGTSQASRRSLDSRQDCGEGQDTLQVGKTVVN
jgi:hypothetical protein